MTLQAKPRIVYYVPLEVEEKCAEIIADSYARDYYVFFQLGSHDADMKLTIISKYSRKEYCRAKRRKDYYTVQSGRCISIKGKLYPLYFDTDVSMGHTLESDVIWYEGERCFRIHYYIFEGATTIYFNDDGLIRVIPSLYKKRM